MKNTITFNPKRELVLPEYGRNIQNLVEYAVSLETVSARTFGLSDESQTELT